MTILRQTLGVLRVANQMYLGSVFPRKAYNCPWGCPLNRDSKCRYTTAPDGNLTCRVKTSAKLCACLSLLNPAH
jgi:hypothetical protein